MECISRGASWFCLRFACPFRLSLSSLAAPRVSEKGCHVPLGLALHIPQLFDAKHRISDKSFHDHIRIDSTTTVDLAVSLDAERP